MGIRIVRRPFSLDLGLMTISTVVKDEVRYCMLFDERNIFPFSREKTEAIIEALQYGLKHITDEEIVELDKRALLEQQPHWFLDTYGHNDPLWAEYVANHPEIYQPPPIKSRKSVTGHVYVIKGGELCKIGCTKNIKQRLRPMGALAPFPLETLVLIASADIEALESELHETFAAKRIRGEWFNLDETDIETIRNTYDLTDPSRLKVK